MTESRPHPAASAAALLRDVAGRAPEGTWSAPGRVNLIGEHTDYNDGFVFPFATPHRTHVALRRRPDRRIRVASDFTGEVVEVGIDELTALFPTDGTPAVPEWAAYPLGVAWALLPHTDPGDLPGVDLAFSSDVPVGAGLSSSAAIEGATASALDEIWGTGLDRVALARIGRTAENEAVGAPTGIMDQLASMLGEEDAGSFIDCRRLTADSIDLGFARAGLSVLVIDTRVKHAHSTGGYGERRAACERGARILGVPALRDVTVDDLERARSELDDVTFRRVRHIVTENARVLDTVKTVRMHGPREIGGLLVASHASLRDDFEVSVAELDTAVDAAMGAGAVGARMTGGGFGGAAIALVADDGVDRVEREVVAAFRARGFAEPECFTVVPSDGARRDS